MTIVNIEGGFLVEGLAIVNIEGEFLVGGLKITCFVVLLWVRNPWGASGIKAPRRAQPPLLLTVRSRSTSHPVILHLLYTRQSISSYTFLSCSTMSTMFAKTFSSVFHARALPRSQPSPSGILRAAAKAHLKTGKYLVSSFYC